MGINLSGILAVIVAVVSLAFYSYFSYSQKTINRLISNNAALEVAIKEQQDTIASIEAKYKNQVSALIALAETNKNLTADKDRLVSKLLDHDLEELSRYKPGLVEKVINNGTQQVFDDFSNLSSN